MVNVQFIELRYNECRDYYSTVVIGYRTYFYGCLIVNTYLVLSYSDLYYKILNTNKYLCQCFIYVLQRGQIPCMKGSNVN